MSFYGIGSYSTKNHNGNIHLLTATEHTGRQPGLGHNNNNKLSDSEVRDIRIRYHKNHETLGSIHRVYSVVQLKYLERIVNYQTRLSAACDI